MSRIDKKILFEQVVAELEKRLETLVDAAFEAKEASTNEESKAENKYDTRGLEASYLAAGQAKRAQDLQEQIYRLKKVNLRSFVSTDAINVSAIVKVSINESKTKIVFLLPIGGVELEYKSQKVQTLTLEAPLGQRLHGQKQEDDFELNGHLYEIVEVY